MKSGAFQEGEEDEKQMNKLSDFERDFDKKLADGAPVKDTDNAVNNEAQKPNPVDVVASDFQGVVIEGRHEEPKYKAFAISIRSRDNAS